MWTIKCVRRYGGEGVVWEVGEGFSADSLDERGGYIYGYDSEGFPYSLPTAHFQYSRYSYSFLPVPSLFQNSQFPY